MVRAQEPPTFVNVTEMLMNNIVWIPDLAFSKP